MAATLLLSGCGTTPLDIGAADLSASADAVKTSMTSICPHLKPMSDAEMDGLAAAIANLPLDSPLIPMAGDYLKMRDETRACRGQPVPGKTGT